jgi:hypothetical protein
MQGHDTKPVKNDDVTIFTGDYEERVGKGWENMRIWTCGNWNSYLSPTNHGAFNLLGTLEKMGMRIRVPTYYDVSRFCGVGVEVAKLKEISLDLRIKDDKRRNSKEWTLLCSRKQ